MKPTPEKTEQIKLHNYCKYHKLLGFAIPNGGTRNLREALSLKKEGVTKGVSDYCVILPNRVLFIEMKRQKHLLQNGTLSNSGSKPTKEQLDFIALANTSKVVVATVCYGFEEAKSFIEQETNQKK